MSLHLFECVCICACWYFPSELCKFQGYFVAALHPFVQAVFFPVWSAHNLLLSYMTAKHSTLTSLQNFPMTNEVVLHVNPPVSTPLESSLISFTVFWLFLVSKLNSVDESSIGYFSKYLAMKDFLKTSQFLLRVFDVHYLILNRSVPLQDFYALFSFFLHHPPNILQDGKICSFPHANDLKEVDYHYF